MTLIINFCKKSTICPLANIGETETYQKQMIGKGLDRLRLTDKGNDRKTKQKCVINLDVIRVRVIKVDYRECRGTVGGLYLMQIPDYLFAAEDAKQTRRMKERDGDFALPQIFKYQSDFKPGGMAASSGYPSEGNYWFWAKISGEVSNQIT
ncbi:hypothetical protein YC2023_057189 [Brassica napus]